MLSLGKAAACIGLAGPFFVIQDFYGYWTRPDADLAVAEQIALLRGKHINLNLIRTYPLADFGGVLLDEGLHVLRRRLAGAGVGVGRIRRFDFIRPEFEIIGDTVSDLSRACAVSNEGIDLFLVRMLAGPALARSPEPGSCSKGRGRSGLAVGFDEFSSPEALGYAMAHEIGHFLNLSHRPDDPLNLMHDQLNPKPKDFPKVAIPVLRERGFLDAGQAAAMKLHCAAVVGCQVDA